MYHICNRCGNRVEEENNPELKKDYPFFCPNCQENMLTFEVTKVEDNCDTCKYDPEFDNKNHCSECCHNYESAWEEKE